MRVLSVLSSTVAEQYRRIAATVPQGFPDYHVLLGKPGTSLGQRFVRNKSLKERYQVGLVGAWLGLGWGSVGARWHRTEVERCQVSRPSRPLAGGRGRSGQAASGGGPGRRGQAS